MMKFIPGAVIAAVALGGGTPLGAQEYPLAADVESPEALSDAAYEALNREPGENFNWERFRSLHLPGALLIPNAEQTEGEQRVLSVDDFVAWIDGWYEANVPIGSPQDQGFVEEGIHVVKNEYGDVVQLMSTYVKRFHGSEDILGRGINAMTMVFDGDRWWIAATAWDEENGAGPIPAQYLP